MFKKWNIRVECPNESRNQRIWDNLTKDTEFLRRTAAIVVIEYKLIVLDVRARDSEGRWLNVEMQVTVSGGLLQRLVYYACSLYVDQLQSGQDYAELRPSFSICLLSEVLFRDSAAPHHRFRLVDDRERRVLADTVEVHTVELTKYDLR